MLKEKMKANINLEQVYMMFKYSEPLITIHRNIKEGYDLENLDYDGLIEVYQATVEELDMILKEEKMTKKEILYLGRAVEAILGEVWAERLKR